MNKRKMIPAAEQLASFLEEINNCTLGELQNYITILIRQYGSAATLTQETMTGDYGCYINFYIEHQRTETKNEEEIQSS